MLSLFLMGCGKDSGDSQHLKTLDSLSGAVNAAIREYEKNDTVMLQKAITRFVHYRQFIQQNVNDTISKEEADNLQHFYASGESLQSFQNGRDSFLQAAHLATSQLQKLAADIKNNAITAEQAQQFIEREKASADNLCETGSFNNKLFYTDLEEFKTSLRAVEQLIRSHNNGELPVIIKDTTSL